MPNLSTLPHDIRYQILALFSEYRSISSLIVASRPFYTSLQPHRVYFLSRFFLKKFEPEANLVVSLSRVRCLPDTPEVWYSFRSAVGDYIDEKFDHFQITHNKNPDTFLSIRQNHETILKSTQRFLQDQIYPHQTSKTPRNPSGAFPLPPPLNSGADLQPTPSVNEYYNIVGGFYRLWIWTLLHGSRYYPRESSDGSFRRGKEKRHVDDMYGYVLEDWGFWNIQNLQILAHWAIGWVDLAIDEENIEMPPATCDMIIHPGEQRRRDSRFQPSPDHDRRDIIGSLIRHNLIGLLEAVGDKSAVKDVVLDIINRSPFPQILTSLERGPRYSTLSCPGNLPTCVTFATEGCIDPIRFRGVNPNRVEIRPLVSGTVEDRKAYEKVFRQSDKWMTMFDWLLGGLGAEPTLEGADFWASVWDDWRLLEWGYWRPDFHFDEEDECGTTQTRLL
ncbi:hypothetical protein TWF192_009124 [Orbilia oligospora]|uniref:F-box domain-containing protein n=1 Tax=Orbilia oligospora TaxID=2813651 RepID=A0A6G1MJR6_ORBOL|nr:hypothetical protein TWF191_007612 [Orbilia oligospora]KAF3261192.1 hypothetical protein TWF192_009124 [Orbilia oligospora]